MLWIVPAPNKPAGHLLKAIRDEHGWSQATAAGYFGVSLRAWQNYEGDKRRVPRPLVKRAVDVLNNGIPSNAETPAQ